MTAKQTMTCGNFTVQIGPMPVDVHWRRSDAHGLESIMLYDRFGEGWMDPEEAVEYNEDVFAALTERGIQVLPCQ